MTAGAPPVPARPLSARWLGALVAAGLAWRLLVSWRTVLPREDGVNYLWMAERFVAGQACAALSVVFSPLTALWIAPFVALGLDPFPAAQCALALAGALAIVPMVRLAEHFEPGWGLAAGLLACLASRPVMLGAQVYSEPLFLLISAAVLLAWVRGHSWTCGLCLGLAFWVRPEAPILLLAIAIAAAIAPADSGIGRQPWRRIARSASVLLLAIVALAGWRYACGHGLDPVPKLAFIRAHNVAEQGDQLGFLLRSLWHLRLVPGEFVSAFGPVALLAILGLLRRRPPGLLVVTLVLATLVICAYVPRWRFFVNWFPVVLPLAVAGLKRLPGATRPTRGPWPGPWPSVALILILLFHLAHAAAGAVDEDRQADRLVAAHLRERLRPGERVAGDLTRLLYFVGQRPLPPRHHSDEELVEAARDARFVVLRSRREKVVEALPGHRPFDLPPSLAALVAERQIVVLERR